MSKIKWLTKIIDRKMSRKAIKRVMIGRLLLAKMKNSIMTCLSGNRLRKWTIETNTCSFTLMSTPRILWISTKKSMRELGTSCSILKVSPLIHWFSRNSTQSFNATQLVRQRIMTSSKRYTSGCLKKLTKETIRLKLLSHVSRLDGPSTSISVLEVKTTIGSNMLSTSCLRMKYALMQRQAKRSHSLSKRWWCVTLAGSASTRYWWSIRN